MEKKVDRLFEDCDDVKIIEIIGMIAHRDNNNGDRAAFTLAEVLITLGIIGVVAAMTLPNLIANYQKNVLKNQFKKTYSMYSQALIKTVYDNGGDIDCYYNENGGMPMRNECTMFLDKFAKNMKVVKICDGNGLKDGCLPKYSSYITVAGCGGFIENVINNQSKIFVLHDGSIIISYDTTVYNHPLFAFDINGFKGPNRPGYDFFSITIYKKNNNDTIYFGTAINACTPLEQGGFTSLNDIMGN